MFSRKGFAAVACAVLACGSVVRAADDQPIAGGNALSLQNPVYADSAPKKPLMDMLDKTGAAKPVEDAGINIGGWVEMSWTHNFNRPGDQINNGRVFDFESDDHTFNQAVLFIEKTVAPDGTKFDWGGRFEYMWGGDARLIHSSGFMDNNGVGNGPDEQCDVTQLYAQFNLPIGTGLILTGGKFVSPLGSETINPTTNWLYSHSYIFGFSGPFTLTGLTTKYWIDKDWSVMVGVVHGWDKTNGDNNDAHSYLAQVAYTSEKWDFTANWLGGPEQDNNSRDWRSVIDLVFTYRAADNLTLMANADYGWEANGAPDGDDAHWCALAGYARYTLNDMFAVVGRLEYFNDQDGGRGIGSTIYEATIGLNIVPLPGNAYGRGLMLRPELRYDYANHDVFDSGSDSNQFTFGADILYVF